MQSSKFIRKINEILNASSESFMLVALISLFALPVVISKSLEPLVASEESVVSIPTIVHYTDKVPDQDGQLASVGTDSQNILGAFNSVDMGRMLIVHEDNLKSFDRVHQKLTPDSYVLFVKRESTFKKVKLFTLRNESTMDKRFTISVIVPEGVERVVNRQKNVYINDKKYVLGTDKFPTDAFNLKPNEELAVYVESSSNTTTELILEVKLD